ncbi:MAG: Trk family potassium uptake protein [Chloroflexi bacterium]|nr:Trk family potassium uptake protein [Chloroflexota bacterium]
MQEPYRHRPGDRFVRRPLEVEPQRIRTEREGPRRTPRPPAWWLLITFAVIILVGTLLLMLPFARSGPGSTPLLTALFTATSALCVTGLTVVDTREHWSVFGQAIIAVLIQIGGLGYMVGVTTLLLAFGRPVTLSQRMVLRESTGGESLGRLDRLAVEIVLVSLAIQAGGALFLFLRFLGDFTPGEALWQAVFHSISAFNNAGFDITRGNSLVEYHGDPLVVVPIGLLCLLGALGFTVLRDIALVRGWQGLRLDTKIVLAGSAALLSIGALSILAGERGNQAGLGAFSLPEQVMDAVFLSVTARTAGFTPVDMGSLRDYSLFLLIALMFIGGASASTAGGIKLNTVGLLVAALWASLRGRAHLEVFRREVPEEQVRRALSLAILGVAWIQVLTLALTLFEPRSFLPIFFEGVSAFGLVGLSTGITPSLSAPSLLLLSLTMFLGRLGPLTVALALARRQVEKRYRYAEEQVKIG